MTFWLGLAALILVLLVLVYLFLIFPRVSNGADMEALRTQYAHRGLWNSRIPENSLSAFQRAMAHGYGIELDIQLSKDKKVMVFHDRNLKRMCGVDRRLSDLTYEELRHLRLAGTNETIPTLKEVLACINGKVPLMIEVKGEKEPLLCSRAARMLDTYPGAFCIESFSPLILNWFKNYRPSYARGQLVTKITHHERKGSRLVNFLLFHLLLNVLSRPDFISVNDSYRNRPVFLLCTKIFHTTGFSWTIRHAKDFQKCHRQGWFCIFEHLSPQKPNSHPIRSPKERNLP